MVQEAVIESFSPENLADVKQTLADNKKWQPMFRFAMISINLVVFLLTIFNFEKLPLLLVIFFWLCMLFVSLVATLFRSAILYSLERDVKEQQKFTGTFRVVEKKVYRSQKYPNKYILVFDLPEAKETEVTFDLWNRVQEGDSFYIEKSRHYGMVFTQLYQGVETRQEVRQ